ncbi:MAG: adenine phosphoribosyltransferase [Candidatus Omnitrophica bacterium]|nr:adenine phosphoribosyltransferase [Candidatus Omnitrophota bacterium]
MNLKKFIRSIPDFPKKGILFRDITPLLKNKQAFKYVIDTFAKKLKNKKIEYIVAAESRGFIFGGALSYKLGCGFVPVRKPGKLPYKTNQYTYNLEYGTDTLEIHQDAFLPKSRILILDDLLATGGTALALIKLVEEMRGKIVAVAFVIELTDLGGRGKIKNYPVISLVQY